MFSYWEQQSFFNYEHIVIGAGITGLSTAIELKEAFPNESVLVLERGFYTTGASSRNAGFACMGSVSELLEDLQTMSEEAVCSLFARRKKGLETLRRRLGDDKIGYAARGSYELIGENETESLNKIEYLNRLLKAITNTPAFVLANEKINEFGFSTTYTRALIANKCEGELDTGKMMRALTDKAIESRVEIKTGANVINFKEEKNSIFVEVRVPFNDEIISLKARTLIICTNAFTKKILPEGDVIPGRGQVLITNPIAGLKFKGIFHFDRGYFYFREINGRVLFGGGRNLDFANETTTQFGINAFIQKELEQKLKDVILPETAFTIERQWSGIMAFGSAKSPVVKSISERVFAAFRLGGMGVALGSEVADEVVRMVVASGK